MVLFALMSDHNQWIYSVRALTEVTALQHHRRYEYTILTLLFILKLHGIVEILYVYITTFTSTQTSYIMYASLYIYRYIFIYLQQDLSSCKRFSLTTATHSSIASLLLTSPRLRHRYTRLLSRRQTQVSRARMTPAPTHIGTRARVTISANLYE